MAKPNFGHVTSVCMRACVCHNIPVIERYLFICLFSWYVCLFVCQLL